MLGKRLKQIILFVLLGLSLKPITVSAKKQITDAGGILDQVAAGTGIEQRDVGSMIGMLIQAALLLTGIIFLVLMVYGGFLWMTARGNDEQITKAKNVIISALIGIVVVVSAYAITTFVTTRLI